MPVAIVNDTALALGFVAGRVRRTGLHLTAIVKGAFRLVHGEVASADERPLLGGDLHWDDDLAQSCRVASDFAPWKPRAEVLVTGTCHAPGGRPTGTARVAVRVGPVRKALVVSGDRHFVEQALGGHAISEPIPFRTVPLRWERAFGGPGFPANPVGKGWAPADGPRSRPLPNVELAGRTVRSPGDTPEPAGLGPIDARWAPRASKLGTYGDAWLAERWPDLPDDLDWSYFNAAPEDQRVAALRGDEPIVLEGLHPELERIESALPGLRPRCFLKKQLARGGVAVEEVELHLDTVTIDADAGTLAVVWRGLSPVESRDFVEVEKALLVVEPLVDTPRPASLHADADAWGAPPVDAAELAAADEAAARAGGPPPPAPPPPAAVDPAEVAERESLDEARADLAKAGADPALLQRLQGVTRAAVFTAILLEEIEKAGKAEPEAPPPADAVKDAPSELDRMRDELRQAGADPALLAKLAAVTTMPRFLEVLLGEMPAGTTRTEQEQRAGLVATVRQLEAEAAREQLEPEARRRATRGDRLTRAEVIALVTGGGSLAEANLTELDLTGVALRGVILAGAKLDGARLAGCDLAGADLTGASARLADLTGALLTDAVLEGIDLEGALLGRADLSRAQLAGANLGSARAEEARLDGADLAGARLGLASLDGASLKEATLDGADLAGASLRQVRAAAVKLRGANLSGADLREARLDGAILIEARLDETQLGGASLRGAHLDDASGRTPSFRDADLSEARASGARFPGGIFEKATARGSTWIGADLSGSDFAGAGLEGVIASGAVLSGAGFDLARLVEADLSRAKLVGARLTRANLFRARLGGADLTDADCRGSNLFECDLFEANATRARFERANVKRTCLDRGAS